MTLTRCDRTVAWAALRGHFEAHGRDFDLREAFARDPARFDALCARGARGLRRPVEEPLGRRDAQAAARPGARDAASRRGATRCSPASRSTPPKAARCCTPRCARRAARRPFSDEVHDVLDAHAGLRRARARHRGQRHPRTSSTSASAARDLGPQMVVPALDAFAHPGHALPLRLQRRRPRHRAGAARG